MARGAARARRLVVGLAVTLAASLLVVVAPLPLASAPHAAAQPPGLIEAWACMQVLLPTDLGTLGGEWTSVNAMNDAGQVVGRSDSVEGEVDEPHAFLWDPTTEEMTDLGTLGGPISVALDINNAGQIVGTADTLPGGSNHAFLWDPTTEQMADLGTLGGPTSWATSINEAGQVVGNASYGSGEWDVHAYLWQDGGPMQDLGDFGGGYSTAGDINEAGVVVGYSWVTEIVHHAFRWTDAAAMEDLGTLGGTRSLAGSINEDGLIAGNSLDAGSTWRPVVWETDDVIHQIGTAEGLAAGLTAEGQVLGWHYNNTTHGGIFVSDPSTYQTEEIADAGYGQGMAINDAGQVAGVATLEDEDEISAGFLWDDDQPRYWGAQGYLITSAINAGGDVAGQYYSDSGSVAFVKKYFSKATEEYCEALIGALVPTVDPLADPVNSATGAYVETRPDAAAAADVYGFELGQLTYDTANTNVGLFGMGWSAGVETRLDPDDPSDLDNSKVQFTTPDGRRARFTNTGAGTWTAPLGIAAKLVYTASPPSGFGPYRLEWANGEVWRFDPQGRLAEMTNGQGQTAQITWSAAGLPTMTNATTGKKLVLIDADADGRVEQVSARNGATPFATYAYGYTDGKLTSASDPTNRTWEYVYNDRGLVEEVTDGGDNLVVRNRHDAQGRVSEQDQPSGDIATFTYGQWDAATSTWVTTAAYQATGEEFNYHHSDSGEVLYVTDSTGKRISEDYDNHSRTDFTDRRGADHKSVYQDTNGDGLGDRLRMQVLPNPADGNLPAITNPPNPNTQTGTFEFFWYWDEKPGTGAPVGDLRVWKHRDPTGAITEYGYEALEQTPNFIIDPTARITCVDSVDGLVKKTIEGAGDSSCNGSTTGKVVTRLFYANEDASIAACPTRMLCSKVVAQGTADESKTVFTYTTAGRLNSRTDAYGTTASGGSPGATTTTYGYDAAGRTTSVTGPLTGAGIYPVRYGYDAAGRLAWKSEANNPYNGGAGYPSVAYTYTADGQVDTERTSTDLSTGASTLTDYAYNASGDLVSVTDGAEGSDGSTVTQSTYGAMGRLEQVKVAPGTAQEQVTTYQYDIDGNQTRRITPEGTWGTGYDFWGRVSCEADPLDVQQFVADGNLNCAAGGGRTFATK